MTLTLGELSYDTTELSEGYVTTVYAGDKMLFDIEGPNAPEIAASVVAAVNEHKELRDISTLVVKADMPDHPKPGCRSIAMGVFGQAVERARAVLDRARKGEG